MEEKNKSRDYLIPFSIVIASLIIAIAWVYTAGLKGEENAAAIVNGKQANLSQVVDKPISDLEAEVVPNEGVKLPVKWGDFGKKLVESGVIDAAKFEEIYVGRGGLDDEANKLLYGVSDDNLRITNENSGVILNLLWAFGLANKNEILEKGPMMDPQYGGAGRFASTGGWTLAKGDAMDHYSRHKFLSLTAEQQALVEKVSKGIYRPCCNNSTYFPDCNHGMAMLGFLEILASQGVSEKGMYRAALALNSYWFTDTYLTIAKYLEAKGMSWENADPKGVLAADFSSVSGYQKILTDVTPPERRGGGGCGV